LRRASFPRCRERRMVRAEGLEPPCLAALEPKSSASTSSATPATAGFVPRPRPPRQGLGGALLTQLHFYPLPTFSIFSPRSCPLLTIKVSPPLRRAWRARATSMPSIQQIVELATAALIFAAAWLRSRRRDDD